jgi:hypothetical protein
MTAIDASPGLPLLATALVTWALMLVAPQFIRAIEALVDQVILARPDYAVAARALDDAFRRATTPGEVIETALDSVRATLHVDASYSDGPAEKLTITTTHEARTLMQPERAFLESVRTQLEHRLDAMRFEAEQRALLLREERLRRLLTEAELKALRTQVDPHFLFNTLNTIADLIGANPQQAERMTERLAECFRYALATHSRDYSTLDEELNFAAPVPRHRAGSLRRAVARAALAWRRHGQRSHSLAAAAALARERDSSRPRAGSAKAAT